MTAPHHHRTARTSGTGSKAESTGHINPKYGSSPGRTFYTHISDQYAPFHTKVVNVGVRDSTYVLDGLLYHESDLRIEEHYTDTAGFTDHVFALMHLLGFRFAPRIRDLGDTKLYIPKGEAAYDALKPMIGGTLNIKHVRAHWEEILRLATSIKQGTVTASLMLRKLGSYPRQNGLAVALRELGRIERTLFILDWLQSVELRRRVHAGLNKGEARNALARAVFFNRLGEIRDRSFEQQRYRASGLNLVTAAIVLWNTVYLERAANACAATVKPSMTACCSTCRHSAGENQRPAITSGVAAPRSARGSSGPTSALRVLAYDDDPRCSVDSGSREWLALAFARGTGNFVLGNRLHRACARLCRPLRVATGASSADAQMVAPLGGSGRKRARNAVEAGARHRGRRRLDTRF